MGGEQEFLWRDVRDKKLATSDVTGQPGVMAIETDFCFIW